MTNDKLYAIGDVARRTGLSVSAIRFYADEGVVTPTGLTDGGYRLYDVEAVARLELVRTLRDLGASVEDVRRVLADETSLHDLASAHLVIVERQLRHLKARRAVLRTVVSQGSSARQIALMHELVSLSDEDRERLLDDFWSEVTDGLAVHPAFVEHLRRLRPVLPQEPGTEQLQAWIELADLVQDADFRDEVRVFFRSSFASPKAALVTSPEVMARVEAHRVIEAEAWEAERSGVEPGSPRGREIGGQLLASLAGLTAEVTGDAPEPAELTRAMSEPDPLVEHHAQEAVARFGGVLQRYLSLMATINGTTDEIGTGASEPWIAPAIQGV
ncbi:helix-turn-helix domain-containing protein [Lentzea cavernae]|uniref:MerR family transcriptional regulator n=1 Tax=Lentzea cavernae TaxID=2020703 RepID=A0ABQ3MQ69_9PSEU|nr:MerR family transcriptional regulator [Lentzea cavernae]GHH52602.1 MerR family transcriptional regulator [Lentzea cavernae]